jgi:hypothetical protein
MSLCYGFQKWTMITFGLVATSLSVQLVLIQYVHGYVDPVIVDYGGHILHSPSR